MSPLSSGHHLLRFMTLTTLTDSQLHRLGNELADQYRATADPSVDDRLMEVFHEMTRREAAGEVALAF